jgi:hypothetical protein
MFSIVENTKEFNEMHLTSNNYPNSSPLFYGFKVAVKETIYITPFI